MRRVLILLTVLALLCVSACAGGGLGGRPENLPYEPDTPAPPPHDGVFVSEAGTMTFNGDGKSIVVDFAPALAERTGVPEGPQEGRYVFVQDLPPYGSVDVRYDTAHELELFLGPEDDPLYIRLELGYASEDGSTAAIYIGAVTEDTIPLLLKNDKWETVLFQKQ